jgi:hypothetical protein
MLSLPAPWEKVPLEIEDKNLRHRFEIVNELLSTETAYVRDLGLIVGVCCVEHQVGSTCVNREHRYSLL